MHKLNADTKTHLSTISGNSTHITESLKTISDDNKKIISKIDELEAKSLLNMEKVSSDTDMKLNFLQQHFSQLLSELNGVLQVVKDNKNDTNDVNVKLDELDKFVLNFKQQFHDLLVHTNTQTTALAPAVEAPATVPANESTTITPTPTEIAPVLITV